MSVVKKYQSGGTIEEYLANALEQERFNKNGLLYARNAASMFAKLAKQGNINEIFEFDPINNRYTVHVDKIKDPTLRAMDWGGTTGEVGPNFLGVYTGRDVKGEKDSGKKKYMGWAATNLYNYMKEHGVSSTGTSGDASSTSLAGTSAPATGRFVYDPYSFDEAMATMRFGNKNSTLSFESLLDKDKGNTARQKLLIDIGREYLQDYYSQSQKPTESGNTYNKIQEVEKILNYLKGTPDFETYRKMVMGLNWDLSKHLLTDDEVQEQQRLEQERILSKKKADFEQSLSETLPLATIKTLADAGYTNLVTGTPGFLPSTTPNLPEVQKWMTDNQIKVLANEAGEERLIGPIFPGGLMLDTHKFNKLTSPLYGTYIGLNNLGRLAYFHKGTEGYDQSMFPQYTGTGEQLRGISGLVNGSRDWKIFGLPKGTEEGYDFLSTLILKHPTKGFMEVTGSPTLGYKDKSGNTVNVVLEDYNTEMWRDPYYPEVIKDIDTDVFSKLPERAVSDYTILQKEFDNLSKQGHLSTNEQEWKDLVSGIRYVLKNGSYLDKSSAAQLYKEVLMNDDKLKKIVTPPTGIPKIIRNIGEELEIIESEEDKKKRAEKEKKRTGSWKKGGVLKMQSGGSFSKANIIPEEDYLRMLRGEKTIPKVAIKDWTGTLKDMTGLEKASLVTSALSILPGIGALGGAATTGIDIARMVAGEDVGLGTIAADLGFTGLSLIGLGGLGAAAKGARAAKKAEDIATFVKSAREAREATKAGKLIVPLKDIKQHKAYISAIDKLSGATPETRTLASLGITAPEEIQALKKLNVIGPKVNKTSVLKKGSQQGLAEKAKQLKGELPRYVADASKSKYTPKLPNEVIEKNLIETLSPKVQKAVNIGKYALAAPLMMSVPNVLAQAGEGGIENIQQEDLKNTLLLAAGITGFVKNKQLASNIKKLIKTKSGKPGVEVSGKKYDIDIDVPEEVKPAKVFAKGLRPGKATKATEAAKEANLKNLNKFKEEFKKKTGKDLPDDLSLSDVKRIAASEVESGILSSKELPKMSSRNYNRARKAIERSGLSGYSRLNWNYKKGGIIKYQTPAGPIPYYFPRTAPLQIPVTGYGNTFIPLSPGITPKTSTAPTQSGAPVTQSIPTTQNRVAFSAGTLNPPVQVVAHSVTPPPILPKGATAFPVKAPTLAPRSFPPVATAPVNMNASGAGKKVPRAKGDGKLLFDPADIVRLAQLTSANYFNNRATKQYIKAVKESYSPDLIAERLHLKMPSLFNPEVEKEAARYSQVGRRMAGSTTDIDKGFAAQLEAESGASDIRLKGALERQDASNKLAEAQQKADYEVGEINRGVINSNRAKYADMNSKIAQTLGLREATQGNIMENFLQATGTSIQNRMDKDEQKKGAEKYFQLYKDPEYRKMINEYNTNYSEGALAEKKKAYIAAQGPNKTQAVPFEQSQEYINFIKAREAMAARLKQWEEGLNMAGVGFRMGVDPKLWSGVKFASGGTLAEKLILERERQNNRLELENFKQTNRTILERTKQSYKAILENNRLMSKVLLNAFK